MSAIDHMFNVYREKFFLALMFHNLHVKKRYTSLIETFISGRGYFSLRDCFGDKLLREEQCDIDSHYSRMRLTSSLRGQSGITVRIFENFDDEFLIFEAGLLYTVYRFPVPFNDNISSDLSDKKLRRLLVLDGMKIRTSYVVTHELLCSTDHSESMNYISQLLGESISSLCEITTENHDRVAKIIDKIQKMITTTDRYS